MGAVRLEAKAEAKDESEIKAVAARHSATKDNTLNERVRP